MRNVFAVYDTEQAYAFRLMEYLNCRKNMPFEVQMFTDQDALVAFTGKRHVDLLLVSERAATDRILELSVGKIIVLSEGECRDDLTEYPAICKYQSAGQIVREAMDIYCAGRDVSAPQIFKPNVRRIGIISTWEPGLRTAFAVVMGEMLAENRCVLYASLDPMSGMTGIFESEPDRTMSELLYDYRQRKNGLIYRADAMVKSIRGMHYIPPASHPGDLMLMHPEQWYGFFNELIRTGTYDTLMLDIGSGAVEPEGILSYCSEIYMPVSSDILARKAAQGMLCWAEDNQAEWRGRMHIVPVDAEAAEELRKICAVPESVAMEGGGYGSGTEENSDAYTDPAEEDGQIPDRRMLLETLRTCRLGKIVQRTEHDRIFGQAEKKEVSL